MGTEFLIDTNAVIDFLENKIPTNGMKLMSKAFNSIPCISVITKIELLTHKEEESLMKIFVSDSIVMGLSNEIIEQTIKIRQSKSIKLPDTIITATALCNGYTLTYKK